MERMERQGQEVGLKVVKQWRKGEQGLKQMAGKRGHPHEM